MITVMMILGQYCLTDGKLTIHLMMKYLMIIYQDFLTDLIWMVRLIIKVIHVIM